MRRPRPRPVVPASPPIAARASLPRALAVALALALGVPAVLAAAPADASASGSALNLRQAPAAAPVAPAPGAATPSPSRRSLVAAVQQATGVSASQVAVSNVCPAPSAGHATCAAQVLVLRSDHRPIHPSVARRRTFGQLFPSRRALAAALAAGPAPAATGSMSSAPASPPAAGSPDYLQQAYDLTYLSQTAGGADTIAVVDAGDDPNAASDLAAYRSAFGLPPCTVASGCLEKVNQSGGSTPLPSSAGSDWVMEESLDLDAISALCPNCHILLVEANSSSLSDLNAAVTTAASLGASQISASWTSTSATAVPFTLPSVPLIAATGDHGYPGAGVDNYPAALPGVTAAGGTMLSEAPTSTDLRGYGEAAWSLNSSGPGWGGGSGCDLGETKPAYQTDTGCTGRAYADISADADPDTGLQVYDSGDGGWFVMGGTSLATPLIAAFEALAGVGGTTAQWAYSDSSRLNDPATGSTGSCAAAISYICNAGPGYDGPTGAGSISGDLVSGAPGIGGPPIGGGSNNTYTQATGTTTATLAGGVYPNGLDTHYYWQYGTSTAYGQQTASVDAGSGTAAAAASASLSGLTPGTTYHYRLVASNADGTDYGYDYTLSTSAVTNVAPIDIVAPAISGTVSQGQTLTASTGSWSPTPTTYAYQWQSSSDGGSTWSSIAGATASGYTVATGDLGNDLRVVVTATDSFGSTAQASAAAGPVTSGAPVDTQAPSISGHPDQGQVLSAISSWSPAATTYAYQWQSSSDGGSTWSSIAGATASTYTPVAGDLGDDLRVNVTATNTYGSTTASSGAIGPIVDNAPIDTAAPALAGSDQRSDTLTATGGSWSGTGNSYSYQWQRSPDGTTWVDIPGAAYATYNLAQADEGDAVRVQVTATNAYGVTSAASAPTPPIAPYPPANTAPPTVTGVAERGATLNATQGTWTGPGNIYSYQWQEDSGQGYVDIVGATASDYTLGTADEGATVRVLVSATNPDATIVQASAPTATVTAAVPVNTTAPSITGTLERSYTLAANIGVWAGSGNAYSYQWERSTDGGGTWTAVASATGAAYQVQAADEGDELRVLVTATNPDGTATAPSGATATVPSSPPVDTTAPTVAGTPQRGLQLSGTIGAWSGPGNSYSYQWQRSAGGTTWTSIAGATGPAYTLADADEGDEVRLAVTASNPDGTATAASAPTAVVAAAPPVDTTAPPLTGTPVRSGSLTAGVGAWSGNGNAYGCQWQRSTDGGATWTAIPGATGWTYQVQVADEGAKLRALITATNADATVSAPSAATATVSASPPVDTVAPTISGPAVRGDALASTEGGWSGTGNSYSYQWQRSTNGTTWTDISGATADGYTLTTADEGDQVRLLVTASNPDGTVSAPSAATGSVSSAPPVDTAPPAVSGPAQRGLTLVSEIGTWDGIGNSYSYQWQRSADGKTWTDIAGATGTSYEPAVADEGDVLRLVVTASNPDATVSADSAPTAIVTATAPSNTVTPTLSGAAVRGGTLLASDGTWLGVGNAYSDQWQRSTDGGASWTDVGGATSGSYPVGVADEGSELRILITATNADGTATAASAPTAVVPSSPPVDQTAPTLSGTAARGHLLTATAGTWSGIGNSLAYQWQRSTDGGATWLDIDGATSDSYTLAIGDEGALIRAQVTASNPDGTAVAVTPATPAVAASPPANTVQPSVTGIARRGNTLSSTTGAWSGTGNTLTLQWQRSADGGSTWSNIAGATGPLYTLQVADEGDPIRLLVIAANPDGSASAASPVTVPVATDPPVDTAVPQITGAAKRTETLTTSSGTWSGAGDSLSYQWQRSADGGSTWTSIAGATEVAYTLGIGDEGDVVRAVVTATNPDGSVVASSAPTAAVAPAPPVATAAPQVLGVPALGRTLSTDGGGWSPSGPTLAYQWQRGDAADGYSDIAGATSADYTAVAADVGYDLRVVVTATNPDGSAVATSAPTATIEQPPVNITAPAAPAGTLMNGYTLTPSDGTWNEASTFSYTWLRCPGTATTVTASCAPISSASAYTLSVSDIGYEIAVTVTATSAGGATSVDSALTGVVTGQPLTDTIPPSISGNPQPPNTLYANPGSWSVTLSTATYQWERCNADGVTGCAIVAADTSHYTLTGADDGHTLVLIADVTSPGRAGTAQSAPLTVEPQPLPQPTVLPTVSGVPIRTHTLAASGGSWTNDPTTLGYQWERCSASGTACAAIPGATAVTYQLTAADEGFEITVAVTAGNSSGANTAQATPTAIVTGLLPVATGAPQLSALGVQQGTPVSVTQGSWQTTAGTAYATQWQRCDATGGSCVAISGASGSSYTPAAADVGSTLRALVTATDVDGSTASASQTSDVVLPAAPRWTTLPVLSATGGAVGDTITVTPGTWSGPAVSSDAIQMMRCTSSCAPIASGTAYTIQNSDVGAVLRVRETASNAGGATVVWSAAYVGPVGSAGAGSVVMITGRAIVRGDTGTALAIAQVSAGASASPDLVARHRGGGTGARHRYEARRQARAGLRTVTVRRARNLRGVLRVWVCPVAAAGRGQAPPACTRQLTLRGRWLKITLPAAMTGRVRVVVVHAEPRRRR